MKIEEGNTLIGKFIDIPHGMRKYTNNPDDKGMLIFQFPTDDRKVFRFKSSEELEFHSSFEWLMPVVEKIQCQFGEDAEFMVRINKGYERGVLKYSAYIKIKNDPEKSETENEYFIASSNSHIESIYLVVIKFIEWYNQDKTK